MQKKIKLLKKESWMKINCVNIAIYDHRQLLDIDNHSPYVGTHFSISELLKGNLLSSFTSFLPVSLFISELYLATKRFIATIKTRFSGVGAYQNGL